MVLTSLRRFEKAEKNASTLATGGFDTAEHEPPKTLKNMLYLKMRCRTLVVLVVHQVHQGLQRLDLPQNLRISQSSDRTRNRYVTARTESDPAE